MLSATANYLLTSEQQQKNEKESNPLLKVCLREKGKGKENSLTRPGISIHQKKKNFLNSHHTVDDRGFLLFETIRPLAANRRIEVRTFHSVVASFLSLSLSLCYRGPYRMGTIERNIDPISMARWWFFLHLIKSTAPIALPSLSLSPA